MSNLANNYRPLIFSDLIGQDVIVQIITNAIKLGRVANAFLLTGSHGTGKTSIARIIAKSLNCKYKKSYDPCMNCSTCNSITKSSHVDVIEMDAASHTSVDDIRLILENAKYLPSQSKIKIYIIDEVHMISTSAFNALLKTIEEPYPHVKFILATTELHKVPATIISRCQRFALKRINNKVLADHLEKIAKKENIEIDRNAILIIANYAQGSVRDALSIFEQLTIYKYKNNISSQDVQNVLCISDENQIFALLDHIVEKNANKLLTLFSHLYNNGSDPMLILHELLEGIHTLCRIQIFPKTTDNTELLSISKKYSTELLNRLWQTLLNGIQSVKIAPNMYTASDIVLLRLCYLSSLPSPIEIIKRINYDNKKSLTIITKEQILDLCKEKGELILYEHLKSNLQIHNISASVIKLKLISTISSLNMITKQLESFLYSHMNHRWIVEIIDINEDSPVVSKVMKAFDNARISRIKKI